MILILVYGFVILIFALSLLMNNRTALKPNKNMLLGVTLPHTKLEDPKVIEILHHYQRSYRIQFGVFLLAAIPLFFIPYVSLTFLYLFLWIGALMLCNDRIIVHHIQQMMELKRKYNWFVGERHVVLVDMEVSSQKRKMAVSSLWLIPPFLASFTPIVLSLISGTLDAMILTFSLCSAACSLLCFFLHRIAVKSRSRAVCENTEVNLAVNAVRIHSWTLCWVLFASIDTAGMLISYFIGFAKQTVLFPTVLAITMMAGVALLFATWHKICLTQNRLLSQSTEPLFADEDEYWEKGYYCNPYDSNITVEKRIGYGYTYNLATSKGKAITYGSLIGATVVFLGLIAAFMVMDFTPFRMTMEKNTVTVSAPMYGYEFPVIQIQSVTLEETLPSSGVRTNGASTDQYDLGNFNIQGYGSVKAYIYKQHPPFVVIELPDLHVILNSKSPEETMEYYNTLLTALKKTAP